MDKQARKANVIEEELERDYKPQVSINPIGEEKYYHHKNFGIISYVKKYLMTKVTDSEGIPRFAKLIEIYDKYSSQKQLLTNKLKSLFKIALTILIWSLISLFLVGYYYWLNITLGIGGMIVIILCVVFFFKLFYFTKTIIEEPY